MKHFTLLIFLFVVIAANAQRAAFDAKAQPAAPDYSKPSNWAALPFRKDAADQIPKSETWVDDSLKQVDVFFVYPTIYRSGKTWNADVNSKGLNNKIDNKPIRYQASVFNQSCRVYAPRYRQAVIDAFFAKGNDGNLSLDFAYEDIKRAFMYYMTYYNNGRPVIIASHSQGTRHARQLLRDFFEDAAMQKKLVAAYVIGFGITDTLYKTLKPCSSETQNNCYITWASYKKGFDPGNSQLYGNVCVNPITWTRDTVAVDASKSMGSMLLKFNKRYEHACGAQIHNNYLWVNSSLPLISSWNVMHIADYNLFWYDIRANVKKRIDAYIDRKSALK